MRAREGTGVPFRPSLPYCTFFRVAYNLERSDKLEKENLDYLRKKLADRKKRVDTR